MKPKFPSLKQVRAWFTEHTKALEGEHQVSAGEPLTWPLSEDRTLTQPLPQRGVTPAPPFVPLAPGQMQVGIGYSVGLQREHNEDALFALTTNLHSNGSDLLFGLFVVADGMGGHQHGEVASETALRALTQRLIQEAYVPLVGTAMPEETSLTETLRAAVYDAHQAVQHNAPGGGTTLTVALILNEQMAVAHVGDSRAYALYPAGRMDILTRDHSLVKRLQELGQLTAEQAAVHPQRNVLYRALGQAEPLDADIFVTAVPRNGHLVLCSDGLWGMVPDEKIYQVVMEAASPAEAAQTLVDEANAAGGVDNISVIVVRFPAAEE